MIGFQFNAIDGHVCPVCGTNEVKDAVNLPVVPCKDPNNVCLVQVHHECVINGLSLLVDENGEEVSVIGKAAPFYTTKKVELKG